MSSRLQPNRLRAAFAVWALLLSLVAPARAAQPASEAELKAVLLFHLTQFVTWPGATNVQSEFVIGILGPDPFEGALQEVVKGEKVGARPIRVVRASRPEELTGAELVYVSPQHRQSLPRVLSQLGSEPKLIVGETDGFIDQGGMLRFKRTDQKKVRLEVALGRVRDEGLNISAQLLRVCDVVDSKSRP